MNLSNRPPFDSLYGRPITYGGYSRSTDYGGYSRSSLSSILTPLGTSSYVRPTYYSRYGRPSYITGLTPTVSSWSTQPTYYDGYSNGGYGYGGYSHDGYSYGGYGNGGYGYGGYGNGGYGYGGYGNGGYTRPSDSAGNVYSRPSIRDVYNYGYADSFSSPYSSSGNRSADAGPGRGSNAPSTSASGNRPPLQPTNGPSSTTANRPRPLAANDSSPAPINRPRSPPLGPVHVTNVLGNEDENHSKHHTSKYETDALILRRGSTFTLTFHTSRLFHKDKDGLVIVLKTWRQPTEKEGTLNYVQLVKDFVKDQWGYKILKIVDKDNENNEYEVSVEIYIPSTCIVSRYQLTVLTEFEERNVVKELTHEYDKDVYILFNPWCEDDEVFLKNEEYRDEYVLNDSGVVFVGFKTPKPWNFAQFTDAVLRCAFILLEKREKIQYRENARAVSRIMSALGNDFDEGGLLSGNWSGDYSGGTKPTHWQGSLKICQQYLETNRPVKFGQCWVFSGILNSLMRALGIPCRSVTNHDSSHDTDSNLTYDKYFDEDGNYLDNESDDSIWNFHVWNECWMARPDLPDGHGGWQVLDATPQERSDDFYQTGPASVRAIKEGRVDLSYDTKFVFAEVNADTIYWKRDKETKKFKPFKIDTDSVGHAITTKKVKAENRWRMAEDITDNYKYPEGSDKERIAVKRALQKVNHPVIKDLPQDVKFSIKVPEEILIGRDANMSVYLENTSRKKLGVVAHVTAQVVRYTGVTLQKLPVQKLTAGLDPFGKSKLDFKYGYSDYATHLNEQPMLRITLMATVQETEQIYATQKIVSLDNPELTLKLVGNRDNRIKPGEDVIVKVTAELPKDIKKLTGCVIEFEGSALDGTAEHSIPDGPVPTSYSFEKQLTLKKSFKDNKKVNLLATLSANEISDLQGILELSVSNFWW